MTENPHENEDLDAPCEKSSQKPAETGESGAWSEDQKRRAYYYDDAAGYEIYNADEDDAEEN